MTLQERARSDEETHREKEQLIFFAEMNRNGHEAMLSLDGHLQQNV